MNKANDLYLARSRQSTYSHGLTWLVLLITLTATAAGWYVFDKALQRENRSYFDFRTRQLLENIQQRIATYQQVLYGARGLFNASDQVLRRDFQQYVAALQLDRRYPGIQGVGFSLWIPPADKVRHEAAILAEGFADYQIRPAGERSAYSSIIYLEPFTGRNLRAFGYDMYSEPVRNLAMQFARDHDSIGMTGKVKLVQETERDVQAGFLMYLPVYRPGLSHDSETQRREQLYGWVYAPFRIKDFIEGVGGERSGDLLLEIYDGQTISQDSLMFSDRTADEDGLEQTLSVQQVISFGGHDWTLLVHASPGLMDMDQGKALIVAVAGLSMSLMLTLLTWQLVNGRSRALQVARQMTAELRESEARFRLMADSAPVLIWVADVDKQLFWFNKVWLDFTGRSLLQEVGTGWQQGLHPDDVPSCLQHYGLYFERRQSYSIEYRLRRHDGEYRWLLENAIPRFDADGSFSGYIGSCVDITERKLMQSALEARNADLTRFAEVTAHHLMEPARRFTSYAQRLRKSLQRYTGILDDEEIAKDLDVLQADAQLLRHLILDVQRYLAAAEPRSEVMMLDTQCLVSELLASFQSQIRESNAEVQLKTLPPVMLDQGRLLDIFSVLLENALRHAHPAQGHLRIVIGGEREGHLKRFYVCDNGPGIPEQYQTRVFEIFERLGPRSADGGGNGIGLAIARRIVESRNGHIGFKQLPEGGTCVVFELPD